jgi:hypothetical protein
MAHSWAHASEKKFIHRFVKTMNISNQADFLSLIESVDAALEARHVPIDQRTLEAIREISQKIGVKLSFIYLEPPRDATPYNMSTLGWHIFNWYKERYGERSTYDMDLGKVAFWLRGDVWFIRVPIIFDWANADLVSFVESLTPALRGTLSGSETNEIKKVFRLGTEAFTYTLMKRSYKYVTESSSDHRSAVDFLKPPSPHPPQSKWASLQTTEKIIKAFTFLKGPNPKYDHKLIKVAQEAEALGLNQVDRALLDQIQCTPNARYGEEPITQQDAILAHQSALQVSVLVAVQIY